MQTVDQLTQAWPGKQGATRRGNKQNAVAVRVRTLLFAVLGLLVNAHGAARGRREWVLRYDGTFTRTALHSNLRPVASFTLGVGTPGAAVSGAACALLLMALLTSRPLLSVPAVLIGVGDIVGDVADALVATVLLVFHSGLSTGASYAVFAVAVIACELYLWRGVLSWYEEELSCYLKTHSKRVRGCISTASSVSSVMG